MAGSTKYRSLAAARQLSASLPTPHARAEPQSGLSCWQLGIGAGLLGVGQNGLLVALPVLVSETRLSLSVWAWLLTLGWMLFLPASPWWGRRIARRGSKPVVHVALAGYTGSFVLLAIACLLLAKDSIGPVIGVAVLILARTTYGLTVSGMVPALQAWAVQRAGAQRRMAALATISSGLSGGRLLGPMAAAGTMVLHPLAPLGLLIVAPIVAWLLILPVASCSPLPRAGQVRGKLSLAVLPYLVCATLLAMAVSLMQLGLAPALRPLFGVDSAQLSRHVAWLLSLAALASLAAQFGVVRRQLLTPRRLLIGAGLLMVTGLGMMIGPHLVLVYVGCCVLSVGAAFATPAYLLLLTEKMADGVAAGWVAASHTVGYGLTAVLVPLVAVTSGEGTLVVAALWAAVLFSLTSGWIRYRHCVCRSRRAGRSAGCRRSGR